MNWTQEQQRGTKLISQWWSPHTHCALWQQRRYDDVRPYQFFTCCHIMLRTQISSRQLVYASPRTAPAASSSFSFITPTPSSMIYVCTYVCIYRYMVKELYEIFYLISNYPHIINRMRFLVLCFPFFFYFFCVHMLHSCLGHISCYIYRDIDPYVLPSIWP